MQHHQLPRLASDPPQANMYMYYIGFRIRCVFGERRTFVYHNPSPCEIIYYTGQKVTIVRDEPLEERAEDVIFVCFNDRESATKVVLRHSRDYVRHSRLLLGKFYTYDAGLNKHLVCFERFDGFLPEGDPKFLARLDNPNSSQDVPGNPNDVVQNEIRELTKALEYMHSEGLSSSLLHLPIGYVYSQGNSSSPGKLKIIMLDFDYKEDHTSVQWNKITARDVQRFGIGLNKYFLKTNVVWPEKDSFMRCFSIRLKDENMRLSMIHDHPFLKDNILEILGIIKEVYWYLKRSYPGDTHLTKLMVALNSKQFKSEFMPDGEWTRQGMSKEFEEFLRGEPRGNTIKYNTMDMGDLVRFVRNVYADDSENAMHVDFIFNEVRRYWPHLIDRFHEKIAGFNKSKTWWF